MTVPAGKTKRFLLRENQAGKSYHNRCSYRELFWQQPERERYHHALTFAQPSRHGPAGSELARDFAPSAIANTLIQSRILIREASRSNENKMSNGAENAAGCR